VTSKDQWPARRAELKALYEHYKYGRRPADPAAVTAAVLHEDPSAFGGKGTLREVELRFDVLGATNPIPIRLLLAVPNGGRPAACFVGPNFQGNHALTDDPKVRLPDVWMYANGKGVKDNRATDVGRGSAKDVWPLELAVGRGYAVATFYSGDVQPDRPGVAEGLRKLLPAGTPAGDETATIMSWAWGVSRAVDYLVTAPGIDGKRIAVVGHSRLGKTALVAGAFDERIALVIPHQSGCGGAGPSRHADPKAETVRRINTSFPHWFCGNFKAFNDATERLPFDQHCLAALCAPRPVLVTNAAEDLWANPAGQFDMLRRATPVYELLGVKGLEADRMPEHGTLVDSRLGYFIRPGKHAMTVPDWEVYLRYADQWLK
jgi:hypothetical protein